MNISNRFAL